MPGKNKWERSRCLALWRVASRAQPRLSVENTNSRAGPVHTHKLMKANSKNSPPKKPLYSKVWEGVKPSCFRARAKLKRWENQNETFPGEGLAPTCLLPSSRHRCCLPRQPVAAPVPTQGPQGNPAGPCPCRVLGSEAKTTSAPMGADPKGWTRAVPAAGL